MTRALLVAALALPALAAAVPPAPAPPDLDALLAAADAADWALRLEQTCDPRHLEALQTAVDALDAAWTAPRAPDDAWPFPVARVSPTASIGGRNGNGFRMGRNLACYAGRNAGHPAHDLFVPDPDADWHDAKDRPWTVHAVEAGVVLVARTGWTPGNASRGGHYVMQYLPGRKVIAYYAHLDRVDVKPGQRVEAGAVLGTVGRTGWNAWPKRSPTHLHFTLWTVPDWKPLDPYRWLAKARTHDGKTSGDAAFRPSSGTSP